MTHSSDLKFEEQAFDLSRESNTFYGGEFSDRVSTYCIDNQPSQEYKTISHTDNKAGYEVNPKFKIHLKSSESKTLKKPNNIVTVDTCYLTTGKYKVYTLYVIYKKVLTNLVPVVIGLTIEAEKSISENTKQGISYYRYRDLANNNSEINLYALKKIGTDKIDKKDLDEEYEALNTTLTFNIETVTGVYLNSLTKKSKEVKIEKIEGPTILRTYPSYVKYTYKFDKGFNELTIVGSDAFLWIFNGYKPSQYNNSNLDSLSVYYWKCDAERKVPLLVQFTPKVGYKYLPDKDKCISEYYSVNNITGKQYEKLDYLDGRTFNIESSIKYEKIYEKITITIFELTGPKLKEICERKNVRKNMEIILGLPPTPEEKGSSAGIAFGIIFFLCVPIGVLTYFHYNRLRASLYDFYYKHRTMHLRGFE